MKILFKVLLVSGLVAYLKGIHYDENGDTSLVNYHYKILSRFGAKQQLISQYFWQREVELARKVAKETPYDSVLVEWLSTMDRSIHDQTGG